MSTQSLPAQVLATKGWFLALLTVKLNYSHPIVCVVVKLLSLSLVPTQPIILQPIILQLGYSVATFTCSHTLATTQPGVLFLVQAWDSSFHNNIISYTHAWTEWLSTVLSAYISLVVYCLQEDRRKNKDASHDKKPRRSTKKIAPVQVGLHRCVPSASHDRLPLGPKQCVIPLVLPFYVCTHTRTLTHTHSHTHSHTRMCIHAHTRTHAYAHAHTHTQPVVNIELVRRHREEDLKKQEEHRKAEKVTGSQLLMWSVVYQLVSSVV